MRKIKSTLKTLWADESGQGATEYILLLVIVVAVAMLFKDQIRDTLTQKLADLNSSIMSFTSN